MSRHRIHISVLGILSVAAGLVAGSGSARADVRIDFRETTWSVRAQPPQQTSVLRSWVEGGKRRIENEVLPASDDPNPPPQLVYCQIDRIDLDSSYVLLPKDSLFGSIPFDRSRDNNRRMLADLVQARATGTAPPDTLPDVSLTEIKAGRRIFGVLCRSFVLELKFEYRDSIPGSGGLRTHGVLTDTVWIAPENSPVSEMRDFEKDFSHATLADSFLATVNAVELSQARGQGLISVVRRAARKLPGFTLASHYRNVILGLPKGMSGVERTPDGAVVVQRAVREATRLEFTEIGDEVFEIPSNYRRDVAGEARGAASGGGARR